MARARARKRTGRPAMVAVAIPALVLALLTGLLSCSPRLLPPHDVPPRVLPPDGLPPGGLPPGDVLPAKDYVGLTKERAIARASQAGTRWRIIQEDSRRYPLTKDLRPSRLNFTIEKGVVVNSTRG